MELERHILPGPDPENAVQLEPMPGGAAAQHASQDAGSWPKELLRPLNWDYDRQQFPDESIGALARSNLLPSEEVVINDEHDTAELRPAKRPRTLDNLHGLAIERQLSEIANSGGGGGAMPAASALQPAQSAGVLKGHSKQPLYSEDARLISGLEEALRNGNAANHTARDYAGSLLSLGRWLFANNKDPIAARLDDQSLTNDAREAIKKGLNRRRLLLAIDHLRTSQSTGGIVPIAGRAKLNPYPQDVALIKEYKNKAATGTVRTYAVVLNSFSDYLRENNKKGIAARLSGKALDGDVESYRKDAGGNRNIGAALADLRKSQAGAKAMELERHISPGPDPENAVLMEPMPAGGAAAQHSASQDAGSWPKELLPVEGYDQDLLWELMDEPGPSSSLLEPAARHDQSSDPGESIRPLNWGSDRQQFPDEPIGALAKSNLLPSKEVLINDEHDTAELRPAKRPRTLDNLHGVAIERQLSEIVASGGRLLTSAPTHQLGASPWQAQPTMQGSGYQDATALQRAVSRPLVLPEGYDQDLRLMVEDGPPWPGVPPEQAQDIVQAGQQEPAWSASTWSPQMPLNFDWSMWPMLEASPAQAARARSSTYGGPPLVDLTAATPSESRDDVNSVPAFPSTSYDAQIGALGPTASPHGRRLVLEDTEWLGDEHVLRDYQLLAQELGGDNPNLAARTRFVDPLITLVSLRLGTESEMLRAFQRIVHDQNGDDTADFLFLPVNNARATNLPGTHWSLLFVDRRDRERPVAYRYDSMGEYNNTPAAELAARLGARLESRGMTQQLNTYDCGVFVVDGTRALVRQLEQGRAPHLLNLSSLVANRQALQNRLRG
uniref:Ubiquitin-like protease family profile domain-containing protein n=2 Tax=Bradyrhizobium quebecense TaxID=2748629 RepID=A0A974AJ03_9BRAD